MKTSDTTAKETKTNQPKTQANPNGIVGGDDHSVSIRWRAAPDFKPDQKTAREDERKVSAEGAEITQPRAKRSDALGLPILRIALSTLISKN